MNSQAGSGFLEGRSSASWEVARRHDPSRKGRSPSYRRRSPSRRRGPAVVRLQTGERNHALREVIAEAAQALGYLALTAVALLLVFAYVP